MPVLGKGDVGLLDQPFDEASEALLLAMDEAEDAATAGLSSTGTPSPGNHVWAVRLFPTRSFTGRPTGPRTVSL